MDLFVLISWKTRLKHRGWSAGECPYCQGLEPFRLEEQVRTFAIYVVPIWTESRGWIARCDFCSRPVTAAAASGAIPLDEWTPASGFASLLRKLGFQDQAAVQKAPADVRLNSLLLAVRDATRMNEMPIIGGLSLGAIGGALLGIPLGLAVHSSQLFSTSMDALGFGMLGATLGAVVGAVVGATIHWVSRREALARDRIVRVASVYSLDLDRLAEISAEYPGHVQRAAIAARDARSFLQHRDD